LITYTVRKETMKKQYREGMVNVCVLLPIETYNRLVDKANYLDMTFQDLLTFTVDSLLGPVPATGDDEHVEDGTYGEH
jgi:hypothetical protein